MKKCGQACHACPCINERKNIKSGNHTWKIEDMLDCNTENFVYLIQCDKENCTENKYIGETEKPLHERLSQHRGYNNKKTQDATGRHFNLPGHTLANMNITIIDRVKTMTPSIEKREKNTILGNSTPITRNEWEPRFGFFLVV